MNIPGLAEIWLDMLKAFGIDDYDTASCNMGTDGGKRLARAYETAVSKLQGRAPSLEQRKDLFSRLVSSSAFNKATDHVNLLNGNASVLDLYRLGEVSLDSTDSKGLALFDKDNRAFFDKIKNCADALTSDTGSDSFNMANIFASWTRNKELAAKLVQQLISAPNVPTIKVSGKDKPTLSIPALDDLTPIAYFSYKSVDAGYIILDVLDEAAVLSYVSSLDENKQVELITADRTRGVLPPMDELPAEPDNSIQLADAFEPTMLLGAAGIVGVVVKPSTVWGSSYEDCTTQNGIMAIVGAVTINQWLDAARIVLGVGV